MNPNTLGPENPPYKLAILRGILERIAQAEHPTKFAVMKQVLLERIADIEAAGEQEPPADS
jgi:hypothetical protein